MAAAARFCQEAEKPPSIRISDHRIDQRFEAVDEAIAMAAMYTAHHANVKAIAVVTESGSACLWMSRIGSGLPIFAFTRHARTRRRVKLYRGVYLIAFDVVYTELRKIYPAVLDELIGCGIVESGDLVLVARGDRLEEQGGTHAMKLLRAGEVPLDPSCSIDW